MISFAATRPARGFGAVDAMWNLPAPRALATSRRVAALAISR
jgi:hypothetical protein